MTSIHLGLGFKKAQDLKIPQSIIYLQRNILLHFFLLRSIFHKMKKIVELAKTF